MHVAGSIWFIAMIAVLDAGCGNTPELCDERGLYCGRTYTKTGMELGFLSPCSLMALQVIILSLHLFTKCIPVTRQTISCLPCAQNLFKDGFVVLLHFPTSSRLSKLLISNDLFSTMHVIFKMLYPNSIVKVELLSLLDNILGQY